MRRELKARQEASIRGVLTLMQAQSNLRAEQLSAPLQPSLVSMPPLVRYCCMNSLSPWHYITACRVLCLTGEDWQSILNSSAVRMLCMLTPALAHLLAKSWS